MINLLELSSMNELSASVLLESIFSHSPLGFQIYDSKGHSLAVNETYKNMFGSVPPPEYCVLKDNQAEETGVLHLIHRAFQGETLEIPVKWFDPKKVTQVEILSGNRVAIETTLLPVRTNDQKVSHVVFIFKDVTNEQIIREENQLIQKELAEKSQMMNMFLDNTKALIYFKNLEGQYIQVNQRWRHVYSKSPADVIGKTDFELFPKEIAEDFVKSDQIAIQERRHFEREETTIHWDGSTRPYFSLKFPMINEDDEVVGICGISTDISELKTVQQELNRARRLESLGILAGGVAHDFNNALGLIHLQAESLQNIVSEEKVRKGLQTILNATSRSAVLTKQLLAFGRKHDRQATSQNLKLFIEDFKKIIGKALGEGIIFETKFQENLWNIFGDPSQLEQVLINLCLNARDAMPRGGRLALEIKNTELTEKMTGRKIGAPSGSYVEICVTDTGHGMSPELQERIFEPFFTTKSKNKGSGLGLSSVIGIVHQNNGDIILESKEGVGTRFRVFFPRYNDEQISAPQSISEESGDSPAHQVILLIEDHPELRMVTADKLRSVGYTVIEAENAIRVQELLRDLTGKVDIIISDVIMPIKTGPEIVQELLVKKGFQKCKFLFVSGYSEEELSKYNINHNDSIFLAKPYSGTELLKKVKSILNSS